MSRRAARNALGLGDYASDEEEEEEGQGGAVDSEDGGGLDGLSSDAAGLTPGEAGGELGFFANREHSEPASTGASWGSAGRDATEGVRAAVDPAPSCSPHQGVLLGLPLELQGLPPGEPDPDLLGKCEAMVAKKRSGTARTFNEVLRSHKGYRNPDLLTKLVEHQGVDQYGSAFDREVFDPAGLPEEDKIAAITTQHERGVEAKKLGREHLRPDQLRAGMGVEFQRGAGMFAGLPASSSGTDLRNPGIVAAVMLKQQAALQAALAVNLAAAPAPVKRSKWDTNTGK